MKYINICKLICCLTIIPFSGWSQQSNGALKSNYNFLRIWRPVMPSNNSSDVISSSRTAAQVIQHTEYYDGLGRNVQGVSKQRSANGKDMVEFHAYDSSGRERIGYIPYISSTTTGDEKSNPRLEQTTFYNTAFPGETRLFAEQVFDKSPLGRVLNVLPAGNNFGGARKGDSTIFLTNTIADSVRIWVLNASEIPVTTSVYPAGELYKTISIDPNGHQIVTYVNREGKTVLKKTQNTSTPGTAHMGWICVYSVYDDMGYLRCEISPLGLQKILGTWNVIDIPELYSSYRYDDYGRVIVKKISDQDSVEMVYDTRNRLVFSRDGNKRSQGQWLANFYDHRDRPSLTAIYNSTANRLDLQNSMNSVAGTTGNITYAEPLPSDLYAEIHDKSSYKARNSVTLLPGFASGTADEITVEIDNSGSSGNIMQTVSSPLPGIQTAALQPLNYIFYDTYDFNGSQSFNPADIAKTSSGNDPYPQRPSTFSNLTTGLITGTKQRILGTDQWLTTTLFYDDKGHIIQEISGNVTGSTGVTSKLYSFDGKLLSTYQRNANYRSQLTPATTILTTYTYNQDGTLAAISKQINDDGLNKKIAQYRYNETGKQISKVIGPALDSLEFSYNIRGWLTGINKGYAVNSVQEGKNHHFGTEFFYNDGDGSPLYDGTISGVKWRGFNDKSYRSYNFSYNVSGSLLKAQFAQYDGGWNTNAGIDFSMKAGDGTNYYTAYDANGNIQSLTQSGSSAGGNSSVIDDLRYSYFSNSNRLKGVTDLVSNVSSDYEDFREIDQKGDNDYSYDANGNLTRDANKAITSIAYNHLNLPEEIRIKGKGIISFLYTAEGEKIRKTVVDSTITPVRRIVTDYIDDFLYINDTLQYFAHDEGRVRIRYRSGEAPQPVFDYFIKDHQDNTRMVLTEQTDFSTYRATMETENAGIEDALFSNIGETRSEKPSGYPDNGTNKNLFLSKLNAKAGGKKIGPSLVLRVMAGDTISIKANAFYKSGSPASQSNPLLPEDMLSGLLQALGGDAISGPSHNGTGISVSNAAFSENLYTDYQAIRKRDNPDIDNRPRAYLNFVLFDDNMQMVKDNSGVRQIKAAPGEIQALAVDRTVINESGFLYVYTSNETEQDVYFDDITVMDITGPVLEETHYYPSGLVMAGISSRAAGSLENRVLYQHKELQHREFSDGTGLNWYDFEARYYDPQLSRWFSPDAAGQYWSPYLAMGNKPQIQVDKDGNFSFIPAIIGAFVGSYFGATRAYNEGGNIPLGALKGAFVGGVGGLLGGIGSGSFLSQVAMGAAQGAITGGLNAAVWNDDIGKGILSGAISGAAFATVTTSIESLRNYKDGFGFGTNDGRMDRFVKESIDPSRVIGVNRDKVAKLQDFINTRYVADGGPKIIFNNLGEGTGSPATMPNGEILIPYRDILFGSGNIKRVISHEMAHYYKSYKWVNGKFTGDFNKASLTDPSVAGGHGSVGYFDSIKNAGRFHTSLSGITDTYKNVVIDNVRYTHTAVYQSGIWKSYNWTKWIHLIPERFAFF